MVVLFLASARLIRLAATDELHWDWLGNAPDDFCDPYQMFFSFLYNYNYSPTWHRIDILVSYTSLDA